MNRVVSWYDIGVFEDEFVLKEQAVKSLNSVEDVSTLIDTFTHFKKEKDYRQVQAVVGCDEGFYYFVVGPTQTDFDLFEFIQSKYFEDIDLSCMNVKFLFPLSKSRGCSVEVLSDDSVESTGLIYDEDDEDDDKTSILEEDFDRTFCLIRKDNTVIQIPESGLTIGRSADADYQIKKAQHISRLHCKVYVDGGALFVKDLNTSNGTFVNGVRLGKGSVFELSSRDTLGLVDEQFEVKEN